ncbi:MAG: glucosaminidase domain-containing protein [Candidatus Puniceispirillales bacterium]
MKKNKSNFRIDIIIIFVILLLGPATGLLLSKTNLLDKIQFLNILRPNVYVYEPIALNYENEIIFSSTKTSDLENLLNQISLNYKNISNLEKLPNFSLLSLPKDLSSVEPTSKRKEIFLSSILPLVIKSSLDILNDRKILCEAIKNKDNKKKEEIAKKHYIDLSKIEKLMIDNTLIRKIDIVPISLVMAQAAAESGWGTSRFALEGNALFGQWTWDKSKGIQPKFASDQKAAVRKFETLSDSVNSYLSNLNTHIAYSSMRTKRNRNCNQKKLISGYELANWMGNYAITRDEYTKLLRLIIKKNNLVLLDSLI